MDLFGVPTNLVPYRNALVLLTKSAAQSLSNDTVTVLSFDTEQHDTEDNHDTIINNSRITIKLPGKYLFTGGARFDTNSVGTRIIFLRKNGTTPIIRSAMVSAGATQNTAPFIAAVFNLLVGDYVELLAYQDSTGSLNVLGDNTQIGSTNFSMSYLGA